MKVFIDDDYLLETDTASKLYHEYAEKQPIIDYHCHLSVKEIAENKAYENITEIWLKGDHYKWRAMRTNGINEKYITGDATDKEKFLKWAETIPYCIGNPLYDWAHLELKRYFGINDLLSPETAEDIWDQCNLMLSRPDFAVRQLIKKSNVVKLCTTDDPTDTLQYHDLLINDDTFHVKVLPSMRFDACLNIENEGFNQWQKRLSEVGGQTIGCYEDFMQALLKRIAYFHSLGCRVSDLALETIAYDDFSEQEIKDIFNIKLNGGLLDRESVNKYKSCVVTHLAKEFARLGWAMQLHIGAIRNNNERMFKVLGPDTGFDSTGDSTFSIGLAKLLNALDKTHQLSKTILYCLNPRDNEVIGTVMGCFQGDDIPGKIQFGPGWWFNDQKDGIEKHLTSLAMLSLLSRFIGMTTDSRSFLSYVRHEYFRRILCNLIGNWVNRKQIPDDISLLGNMVKNICFDNANNYFKI